MCIKKISIIIPVYNTEMYLERCVRSLMNQTYKNLEIICVDDGSNDGSGEILDNLAREDCRIIVVHKENEGVSAARNKALFCATGDYIAFVDSDDYVDSHMYEKMISKMEKCDADIVTCGYFFDNEGAISKVCNQKYVIEEALPISDFLIYMYERDVYKGVAGYLWTRLLKRKILYQDNNNIPKITFCSEYGGADDIVFVAEMTVASEKIAYLNENLYYYFQREGSIVHDDRKHLETLHWITAYEKIFEIYKNCGEKEILDYIVRMYVYRCGKLLESAFNYKDKEKELILKDKIKENLSVYINTNLEHLERVKWIIDLLLRDLT